MVLEDYLLKMEKILKEMRVMFVDLELEAPTKPITIMPLEVVPKLSVDTEVLPLLE